MGEEGNPAFESTKADSGHATSVRQFGNHILSLYHHLTDRKPRSLARRAVVRRIKSLEGFVVPSPESRTRRTTTRRTEEDELIDGASWQVPGPGSFPTGERFSTSTETYASGGPPDPGVSWVTLAAKEAVEKRRQEQGQ